MLSLIPPLPGSNPTRSSRGPTHLGMTGNCLVDTARKRGLFQEVGLGQALSAQHGGDGLEEVHVVCVSVLLGENVRKFSPHLQDTKKRIPPNKRNNPNERRKQHAVHGTQKVIA